MLYYGVIIALVILLVKGVDYSLFSKQISTEVYTSILVVLFTGMGLWLGLRFTKPKIVVETRVVDNLDPVMLSTNGISDREYEILNLISAGHSNKEISAQLFISISTVKSHLQNTYQKLEVKNRTQAIQKEAYSELEKALST